MNAVPLEGGYAQFVQSHSGMQNNNLQNVQSLIFGNDHIILAGGNMVDNALTSRRVN